MRETCCGQCTNRWISKARSEEHGSCIPVDPNYIRSRTHMDITAQSMHWEMYTLYAAMATVFWCMTDITVAVVFLECSELEDTKITCILSEYLKTLETGVLLRLVEFISHNTCALKTFGSPKWKIPEAVSTSQMVAESLSANATSDQTTMFSW